MSQRERAQAYYYGFDLTGEPVVDGVLRAVARAGKAEHYTSSWRELDPGSGDGTATSEELIQAAADRGAAELATLRARVADLQVQLSGADTVADMLRSERNDQWDKRRAAEARAHQLAAVVERVRKAVADWDLRGHAEEIEALLPPRSP